MRELGLDRRSTFFPSISSVHLDVSARDPDLTTPPPLFAFFFLFFFFFCFFRFLMLFMIVACGRASPRDPSRSCFARHRDEHRMSAGTVSLVKRPKEAMTIPPQRAARQYV